MTQPLAERDLDQISRQLMSRLRIPHGTELAITLGYGHQKTNLDAIRLWAKSVVANTRTPPAYEWPEYLAQRLASHLIDLRPEASDQIAECLVYQTPDSTERRRPRRKGNVVELFRKD